MTDAVPFADFRYRVPLSDVERELNRQMKALHSTDGRPLQRARMSNLIIYCTGLEQSIDINDQVPAISYAHPARVILLVAEADTERDLTARVTVRPLLSGKKSYACVEMVTLHAGGSNIDRLPFAVRSLLIGDLPVNLWWEAPVPPPLAGPLLDDLSEYAQQIIYDSVGWREPPRSVSATATWLEQIERPGGRWRVASDLNWRRLKYWRRILAQALAEESAPGAAASVREITITHGPHAVIQGWLLGSWLSRLLGWRAGSGRVTPGVEMAWHFLTSQGDDAHVHIRRADAGPPLVCDVRLRCALDGKPVTIVATADEPQRLSVQMEGIDAAPRTISVQSQTPVDLIARQLSDRKRDPVFRESMVVAQIMAQSVLG
ncbi:MAG: glucose-6-phosphate dehydrogenase assembly protein OpcA [Gemmataceae bacterium]